MDKNFTSSDYRALIIATERIAKLDTDDGVGVGRLKFYYGATPSGRALRISIGENWIKIAVYPMFNGRPRWSSTPKIYAHHSPTTEGHDEIDKAIAILRWLEDLK